MKGQVICYRYVCPKCHSSGIFPERESKVTVWRCSRCGYEFVKPLKIIFPPSARRDVLRKMVKLFAFHHKDEIYAKFQSHWQKLTEDYLNFKDVIVLCRRCAFARLLGFRLCPVCKQRYYRDIPRSNRKMCWLCFIKTEEGKAYLANLQKRRRKEIREKDFAIDEMQKFLKGLSREELDEYIHWRLHRKAVEESVENVMSGVGKNKWKKVMALLDELLGKICPTF